MGFAPRASSTISPQLPDGYTLLQHLGDGGMASVCAVCRPGSPIECFKFTRTELASRVEIQRLHDEFLFLGKVSNRYVIKAHEYICTSAVAGYTMEFCGGNDLATILNRSWVLAPKVAKTIAVQICRGLIAIHDAGLIHRDLKPENILITEQGTVKILDLGISVPTGATCLPELSLGTPGYVPPADYEQSFPDFRYDIFSVGVMGVEMLTGENPLIASDDSAASYEQVAPRTLAFGELRELLELLQIFRRAMSPERTHRHATARELLTELLLLESPTSASRKQKEVLDLPKMRIAAQRPLHATPVPEQRRSDIAWSRPSEFVRTQQILR